MGCSGAIFGLFGSMVAYLYINWKALEHNENDRNNLMCIGFLVPMLIIMLEIGVPEIDVYAHVGGFISGFLYGYYCAGVISIRRRRPPKQKLALFLLVCILGGGVILFYMV